MSNHPVELGGEQPKRIARIHVVIGLTLLSVVASVLWIVGAVVILVRERIPGPIARLLALPPRILRRAELVHAA